MKYDYIIVGSGLFGSIFARELTDAGFKIYLDPAMTCNHIGTLKFTGNFEQWMEHLKGITND